MEYHTSFPCLLIGGSVYVDAPLWDLFYPLAFYVSELRNEVDDHLSLNGSAWMTGVTCDNSTGFDRRVVGLELGSKRLSGKICGSLAGLNQLRVLNFSHNFLKGSLPDELFSLPNIEIIDISNNAFVGSINNKDENILSESLLESFFQLKNLSELNLQGNSISGSLSNRIGNLSNLVKLDISSNLFSGVLPDIFTRLARLKQFSASGCSRHMTREKSLFKSLKEKEDGFVTFGDGSHSQVLRKGTVDIPDLPLLTDMLCSSLKGLRTTDNCYGVIPKPSIACRSARVNLFELWHQRLGHANYKQVAKVSKLEAVVGQPKFGKIEKNVCGPCQLGKQTKSSHPKVNVVATSRPLELLHVDLMGPTRTESMGGK
ncbi:leucine-rich repeat receptor protein kinase EMS1-like [Quercus suber]|uniref:leucine-rich repeat receptor protein kinase EMS1-like n=1 Tax=Quercus suber TaxID=58331 RepID=UPI0032DEFA51